MPKKCSWRGKAKDREDHEWGGSSENAFTVEVASKNLNGHDKGKWGKSTNRERKKVEASDLRGIPGFQGARQSGDRGENINGEKREGGTKRGKLPGQQKGKNSSRSRKTDATHKREKSAALLAVGGTGKGKGNSVVQTKFARIDTGLQSQMVPHKKKTGNSGGAHRGSSEGRWGYGY